MLAGMVLALGAVVLCVPPQHSPLKTGAGQTSAAPATPSISWHTPGEIAVPFEYFKNHIYVPVSINGKPGFIFMLDSGANRNILNLRTARQLRLKSGAMKQEKNIGFGGALIYTARQEDVDAEIDSEPVARAMSVMDLTRFEQHFGHATDGMLGYPFFRRFVVNVDFQKRLLFVFPADRYHYRGRGFRVALKPSQNFVVMSVTVAGGRHIRHQVDVAVDTGSDVTLMLYEPFARALNLEESLQKALPATAFGLNGYYPVALGDVDSFRIGDAETHNVPIDYLADNEQVGPEKTIPGAIGMGVLRSFRTVTFDVPHRRIMFELEPPPLSSGIVRAVTY